jgi:hypothetical protein
MRLGVLRPHVRAMLRQVENARALEIKMNLH